MTARFLRSAVRAATGLAGFTTPPMNIIGMEPFC